MNDDQLQQILQRIDGLGRRIDSVETGLGAHIDSVEKNLSDRMDQQFAYLDTKIDSIREELQGQMRTGFDRVNNVLDQQSVLLDRNETERLSLSKQVDRHEDWIQRAAKATGVRFAHTD